MKSLLSSPLVRAGITAGLAIVSLTSAAAQFAEPIITRTAIPQPLGDTSLQLLFVSPLGKGRWALPQTRLDIGLGGGLQTTLQLPLLRITEPNGGSIFGAGQFSAALQYLLAGSASADYAMSIATRVEVASGDSRLAGNETQIVPSVLLEWRVSPGLVFRSATSWDRTVAGTTGRFSLLGYNNALSWMNKSDFVPTIEIAGSTETFHRYTEVAIQPEIIFTRIRDAELKFGVSFEMVPTANYAIRAELAWFRGKESARRHR